jgi:hypothetical protein
MVKHPAKLPIAKGKKAKINVDKAAARARAAFGMSTYNSPARVSPVKELVPKAKLPIAKEPQAKINVDKAAARAHAAFGFS